MTRPRRQLTNPSRLLAVAIGLAVLAPMAAAARNIMGYTRPSVRDMFHTTQSGARGGGRSSSRTASMDKRDAVKRRNVLRNRKAHR